MAWLIPDFLARHAPLPAKKLNPAVRRQRSASLPSCLSPPASRRRCRQDPVAFRRDAARAAADTFPRDAQVLRMQAAAWMVALASECARGDLHGLRPAETEATLRHRTQLLLNGVMLAHAMSNRVKTLMSLHVAAGVALQVRLPLLWPLAATADLRACVRAFSLAAALSAVHW